MAREMPPFGGWNDPDFVRGVAWIMGFIDTRDWERRVARIEHNLESGVAPIKPDTPRVEDCA
jgi:hypothetical protein